VRCVDGRFGGSLVENLVVENVAFLYGGTGRRHREKIKRRKNTSQSKNDSKALFSEAFGEERQGKERERGMNEVLRRREEKIGEEIVL